MLSAILVLMSILCESGPSLLMCEAMMYLASGLAGCLSHPRLWTICAKDTHQHWEVEIQLQEICISHNLDLCHTTWGFS